MFILIEKQSSWSNSSANAEEAPGAYSTQACYTLPTLIVIFSETIARSDKGIDSKICISTRSITLVSIIFQKLLFLLRQIRKTVIFMAFYRFQHKIKFAGNFTTISVISGSKSPSIDNFKKTRVNLFQNYTPIYPLIKKNVPTFFLDQANRFRSDLKKNRVI